MNLGTLSLRLAPGPLRGRVESRLGQFAKEEFARRLWAKDPTLWFPGGVPEIENRLGWLDLPETMAEALEDLRAFADEVRAEGIRDVVVLGMGGSSLAPDVYARTLAPPAGYPRLAVLDTTHPAAVSAAARRLDPEKTLFLVSSKSGTTLETLSLFRYFWAQAQTATRSPGRHFAAVTDGGTPLESLGRERGFRRIFAADPDVGGRYSALTHFGLVPAALAGADLGALLESARTAAGACSAGASPSAHPGLLLGAALGEAALSGRDKLTFLTSPSLASVPSWMEQLVAESTGKSGRGIVPVADEPARASGDYGEDRLFACFRLQGEEDAEQERLLDALEAAGHPVARMTLGRRTDLGGLFFLWETAVAAAGAVLRIHPFDQPDVQLAKELAKRAMAGERVAGPEGGAPAPAAQGPGAAAALAEWDAGARPGGYLCLQAYLAPGSATWSGLQALRREISDRTGCPTTSGYGPRFLHSTGQLHKGGPPSGRFLQIVDRPAPEVPVPETDFTFNALIRAQAEGDRAALVQRGRRVLTIDLGAEGPAGLDALRRALRG